METNNWETRFKEIINENWREFINSDIKFQKISQEERNNLVINMQDYTTNPILIKSMLELAKEVHNKACNEQKKICFKNAKIKVSCECSYPKYVNENNGRLFNHSFEDTSALSCNCIESVAYIQKEQIQSQIDILKLVSNKYDMKDQFNTEIEELEQQIEYIY